MTDEIAALKAEIERLKVEIEHLKAPTLAPAWRYVKPRRPRRNRDRDSTIIADHQAGCTIAELAKHHGITPGRVAAIIRYDYASYTP